MTSEIQKGSDAIRTKTLTELNEDFRRSDFISESLQTSDLLK